MASPARTPPRKQATPQELRDNCLDFLQRKFYPGRPIDFAKDRPRLLAWVVLWPAKWFNERGVTVPPEQYRQIFEGVFMDGLRFGDTGNITYLPAWLAKVIQSHFAHHGEDYYAQAKKLRDDPLLARLLANGQLPTRTEDPIRALAQAARLLKPKPVKKAPIKDQLTLL